MKTKLPKRIKIGTKWVKIEHLHNVKTEDGEEVMGRYNYRRYRMQIAHKYPAAEVRNTFWHEVIHGILYDMGHDLATNEKFVTAFANRLSDAIDSAKF